LIETRQAPGTAAGYEVAFGVFERFCKDCGIETVGQIAENVAHDFITAERKRRMLTSISRTCRSASMLRKDVRPFGGLCRSLRRLRPFSLITSDCASDTSPDSPGSEFNVAMTVGGPRQHDDSRRTASSSAGRPVNYRASQWLRSSIACAPDYRSKVSSRPTCTRICSATTTLRVRPLTARTRQC
jgi:hypothetical protein